MDSLGRCATHHRHVYWARVAERIQMTALTKAEREARRDKTLDRSAFECALLDTCDALEADSQYHLEAAASSHRRVVELENAAEEAGTADKIALITLREDAKRRLDSASIRIAELEQTADRRQKNNLALIESMKEIENERDLLAARVEWAKSLAADTSLREGAMLVALNATDDDVRAWMEQRKGQR